jgi:hypothetical protein
MLAASSTLALIGIIVIILLCIAQFYLKSSALTSFATAISALFGMIIAFNYYEALADQLISRGYEWQWAQAGCFVLLFIIGLAAIRSLGDFLLGSNINLGLAAKRTAAGICAVITGLIISGVFLITLALSPAGPKLSYNRFDQAITTAAINNPNKLALNVDGFVAGLFGWISKGSLSSSKSFAVYHADFVDQIHLNSYKAPEKVFIISSKDALTIPGKGKKAVRRKEIDGQKLTVARIGLIDRDIADGGAKDPKKMVSFTPSQIRLVCKETGQSDTITGNTKVVYPTLITKIKDKTTGLEDETISVKKDLGTIITLQGQDFQKRVGWLDIGFQVPDRMEGVLLQFKQNAVIKLPKPVTSTDEIEEQLNSSKSTASSAPPESSPQPR